MWNYINYYFYLKQKGEYELDYLEYYIYKSFENKRLEWIPREYIHEESLEIS